jgi:hypothetical protein
MALRITASEHASNAIPQWMLRNSTREGTDVPP